NSPLKAYILHNVPPPASGRQRAQVLCYALSSAKQAFHGYTAPHGSGLRRAERDLPSLLYKYMEPKKVHGRSSGEPACTKKQIEICFCMFTVLLPERFGNHDFLSPSAPIAGILQRAIRLQSCFLLKTPESMIPSAG